MRTRRVIGLLGLLLATAALSRARDEPAAGGKAGDVIPATFRMFLVVDDRFPPKVSPPVKPEDRDPRDRTNKIHCLVCENGLSPMVAVFVRAEAKDLQPTGGVARLIQSVNKLIPEYRGDKLSGFVAFLKTGSVADDFKNVNISTAIKNADDSKATVDVAYGQNEKVVTITEKAGKTQTELNFEYPDDEQRNTWAGDIRALSNAVKAPNLPFGLAPISSKLTEAWGLAANDQVTVVIYNRYRIVKRWTFDANGPTDAQLKEITAAIEEMVSTPPGVIPKP